MWKHESTRENRIFTIFLRCQENRGWKFFLSTLEFLIGQEQSTRGCSMHKNKRKVYGNKILSFSRKTKHRTIKFHPTLLVYSRKQIQTNEIKINSMLDKFSSPMFAKTKRSTWQKISFFSNRYFSTKLPVQRSKEKRAFRNSFFLFHRICYSIPKWNEPTGVMQLKGTWYVSIWH